MGHSQPQLSVVTPFGCGTGRGLIFSEHAEEAGEFKTNTLQGHLAMQS